MLKGRNDTGEGKIKMAEQTLTNKGIVEMFEWFNKRLADLENKVNDLEQREGNGEEITNLYSTIEELKNRMNKLEGKKKNGG